MKQTKRAEKLLSVLSDYDSWDSWIIRNPGRMAKMLGLCSDGTIAIAELAPSLVILQQLLRKNNTQGNLKNNIISTTNVRRVLMGDETNEVIVKGVEKLLGFLEVGVKEKKKKDKLAALVKAWERCGFYKDLFIQKFLNEKINNENKKKALEVYNDLKALQEALKQLRKEIEHDDEKGIEEATDKVQKLADKILTGLMAL